MNHASFITTEERFKFTFNKAGLIYALPGAIVPLVGVFWGAKLTDVIPWAIIIPTAVLFLRFCLSTECLVDINFPQVRCAACGQMHRPPPFVYAEPNGATHERQPEAQAADPADRPDQRPAA